MLRANLSTRPFYNDRIVRLLVVGLAVLVLALTAYNAMRFLSLSTRRAETDARVTTSRREASEFRVEASPLRREAGESTLGTVAASTRQANALIQQRTFSWTALLAALENAMPPDVRLVSVSPLVDNTVLKVSITVVARELVDVDSLIDALADTGAFYDLVPTETQGREDGTYTALVDTSYLPRDVEPRPSDASDEPAEGRP